MIGGLGCFLVERNAVDGVDQRPQQRVAGEHEGGQRHGLRDHVGAGTGADRGRSPQRRRGVEPTDIHAFFHDDACPEEADAGDDIGDHPHAAVSAGKMHGEVDKSGSPDRNQHIGAQAGGALAILPLGADQRAQYEGHSEADQRVEEIGGLKSGQKLHRRGPSLVGDVLQFQEPRVTLFVGEGEPAPLAFQAKAEIAAPLLRRTRTSAPSSRRIISTVPSL